MGFFTCNPLIYTAREHLLRYLELGFRIWTQIAIFLLATPFVFQSDYQSKMPGFRDFRSLTDLTPAEIVKLKTHCFKDMNVVGNHHFFKGRDTGDYAQTTFDFRDVRYHMKRHQLALFLKKFEDPSFDTANWENSTTSHLCGKKSCIRQEHLELESMSLNIERVHCFAIGRCTHHGVSPDCLI